MHLNKALLVSLSASLITAWEFKSNDNRQSGSRTQGCQSLDHPRGDKLKWHPYEGTQNGAKCCLYVYKREGCDGDSRGMCRDHNDDLDFHFRSFEIDCDGRKTGGNQGSPPPNSNSPQYDSYRPNQGPPSDSYRPNQFPPYDSPEPYRPNQPPPYESNRPNQSPPYEPYRPNQPPPYEPYRPNQPPTYEPNRPNEPPRNEPNRPSEPDEPDESPRRGGESNTQDEESQDDGNRRPRR
jgi:hypothetical protein